MSNLLTTPTGALNFLAHLKPLENSFTGRTEYSARIEMDTTTTEGAAFLKTVRSINKNLGSTDKVTKEGNVFINAKSKNKPTILDADGNVLDKENVPMIESGEVKLIVSTFDSKKGGGICLEAIQLINVVEYTGTSDVDEDALKAAVKSA